MVSLSALILALGLGNTGVLQASKPTRVQVFQGSPNEKLPESVRRSMKYGMAQSSLLVFRADKTWAFYALGKPKVYGTYTPTAKAGFSATTKTGMRAQFRFDSASHTLTPTDGSFVNPFTALDLGRDVSASEYYQATTGGELPQSADDAKAYERGLSSLLALSPDGTFRLFQLGKVAFTGTYVKVKGGRQAYLELKLTTARSADRFEIDPATNVLKPVSSRLFLHPYLRIDLTRTVLGPGEGY